MGVHVGGSQGEKKGAEKGERRKKKKSNVKMAGTLEVVQKQSTRFHYTYLDN